MSAKASDEKRKKDVDQYVLDEKRRVVMPSMRKEDRVESLLKYPTHPYAAWKRLATKQLVNENISEISGI